MAIKVSSRAVMLFLSNMLLLQETPHTMAQAYETDADIKE